jgi:DNA-binding LacI/PurR family transcriptional regulator/DNA-binding transcriptional regulator YhcF (GntR family)
MPKILQETKHYQVTRQLRGDIKQLKPHDLVPTAAELVSRYETSHATVIRALSSLRRDDMIYRPAGEKRYKVAEFTAKPLARIAIVRPQYPSTGLDRNIRQIVETGHKLHLAFDFKHYENMSVLDLNRVSEGCDAIILMPTTEPIPAHIDKALIKPSKPTVLLTHHVDLPNICSVTVDDQQVGRMAVEHLQSLGHTHCLIVLDENFDSTIQARLQGWQEQMAKQLDPQMLPPLICDAGVKPFDDARYVTYQQFKAFLSSDKKPYFSAVFCTTDSGAQAITRACMELGIRIPQDLSLIAFTGSNKIGEYTNPPMTTVEADLYDLGTRICNMLMTQLKNQPPTQRHTQVPPNLFVRKTTIACKASTEN